VLHAVGVCGHDGVPLTQSSTSFPPALVGDRRPWVSAFRAMGALTPVLRERGAKSTHARGAQPAREPGRMERG
jgi:hypothetical protein